MKPKRIQRKRTKGWTMPENTIYVGRPSKWGNPINWKDLKLMYDLTDQQAKEMALKEFEDFIGFLDLPAIRAGLRGKNLACWCKPGDPCHADILLKIANE